MSTPKRTGAGSRRRTAGLALLALSVITTVIGLVLAVNRAPTTVTAPSVAPTQTPTVASPRPSVIPFPPVASSPPAAPPAASSDTGEETPGGDKGSGGEKGLNRSAVRVYNNSTIHGLAARAAGDLTAAGWTVVEVGNYARGTIPTTTVYYQEDADQRAAAEAIATEFKMRIEPRFPGISSAGPGIIVIVTNDYTR